jgi:hypothetical protein
MSSFQSILDALDQYAEQTGINLKENPFANKVKGCDSPNAILQNNECKTAAHELREATDPDAIRQLGHTLKQVTCKAKQEWANEYITSANVWEVAAWRHGRCSSHIAALRTPDSTLSFDHKTMADTLPQRFFTEDQGVIPQHFMDDPPPCEVRPFHPFGEDELFALLKAAANKSALGGSGIGWELMKKGWSHMSELLTGVYNTCITLGHHPARWKEATVVVIPKVDKPDYSAAKAFGLSRYLRT